MRRPQTALGVRQAHEIAIQFGVAPIDVIVTNTAGERAERHVWRLCRDAAEPGKAVVRKHRILAAASAAG